MADVHLNHGYLLKLGEGREKIYEEEGENKIKIPTEHLTSCLGDLVDFTFPDLEYGCNGLNNLIDGTIYTPLNKYVKEINDHCIDKYPGETRNYLSADSILEDSHKDAIPTEFINTITPSGLPDHRLILKNGCPVMLLRNLQAGPNSSLRNGTRMVIVQMMNRAIECEVAVGNNKGLRVFLPRIPHHDRSEEYPFTVVRRQFPIRLAFGVSINKGQGQENERVGVYLPNPVFCHGQLYTAFSRGKRKKNVKVAIMESAEGYTDNIVYKELICVN